MEIGNYIGKPLKNTRDIPGLGNIYNDVDSSVWIQTDIKMWDYLYERTRVLVISLFETEKQFLKRWK